MQNRTLIILTLVFLPLGLSAFFLEERPITDEDALMLSFTEFDELVEQKVRKISPLKLAKLLMEQNQNYFLLDLREAADYKIPTSENYDLNLIKQSKWRLNDNIILYSENEAEALQAYYLLMIRGFFKVTILSGGFEAWKKEVLFPQKSEIPAELLKEREKTSRFFGGELSDSNSSPPSAPNPIQLLKQKHQRHGC
ncbi:rhodanese-like domain-containing protein [Aliikangiella sp. G2MR2-5]|uniref:rhodanese-like domain-containing protein n=1 Tax=Aliikangiella sp. G2MR2-5 TaxID=2788943 RepID=UPI0018AA6511|nr:rhodanese-like domain-containing protein [Aliikangiella sp. G2MR2-5]